MTEIRGKRVLPHMRKERSSLIVNIASVASKHGVPYLGAYGASRRQERWWRG